MGKIESTNILLFSDTICQNYILAVSNIAFLTPMDPNPELPPSGLFEGLTQRTEV